MNFIQKGILRMLGLDVSGQQHVSASLYPQRLSGGSSAGVSVNVDRALSLSAVWACVRRLSETISTMPLQMFERLPNGGRKAVDYGHPLFYFLHDSPNADQTSIEFWQSMAVSVELWGNAYAAKQSVGGQLVGLDFLRPDCMSVKKLSDGTVEYTYRDRSTQKVYHDDEVLHIKGMSMDGIQGLSTIAYMRNTIGIGVALEDSAGDVFKNGMRPSGVFSVQQKMKDGQMEELYNRLSAFKNERNGGILVTELGQNFQVVSINPEDAQLLASRNWSVEEVCRWFGVPPYMVGYTEKSTSWGTGMEQQNQIYLMYTILPRIRKIEQAIERSLLSAEERQRFFVRFNYEGLLRADSKTRAEVHQIEVRNGIRSRNEVRAHENLDPYAGGDVYTIESNMQTMDKAIRGE